jgi:hypothetical protein
VSDVRLRDGGVGPSVSATAAPIGKGVVDVESLAFGVDDPSSSVSPPGGGVVPLPFVSHARTWGEPVPRLASNALSVSLTNVDSVSLDLRRARLDARRPIVVSVVTDGPATLRLVDERRGGVVATSVAVGPGVGVVTVPPSAFTRS